MPYRKLSRRGLLLAAAAIAAMPAQIPLPAGKLRVILDTDTYNEIDDQFAVAYALLAPEKLDVQALYAAPFLNSRSKSAGDGMQRSYEEIERVLDRLGKKGAVPVHKGSQQFMQVTGKPVDSPAARDLIRRALAADEMLYVATVGAPTNVSSALLLEPKIKEKITVVWLGGQPHDFDTAREFNLMQDPLASQVLFDCGVSLVQVPTTNISEMLRTTTVELARWIRGKTSIGDYLYKIFEEYEKEHASNAATPYSKVIWDISAIAWLINPEWIPTKIVSSPVLTEDLHWGVTHSRHPIRVATHVNRDAVFGDLFARIVKA